MSRMLMVMTLALLAGCSGNSPTSPADGGGSNGGGSNGGGSSGGNSGGSTNSPPPQAAAVTVGNILFKSGHNGTTNPAVDTVAVGGTVTWTWVSSGDISHSIQSIGTPSFTSSAIQAGNGKTYQMQFTAAGTYQYDCAVHGAAMSGTIVVR
jgi:plastocyanin